MTLKILALETSGLYGSAALAEDGQLVVEESLAPPVRSAQGLAPLLDRLLRSAGWRPADVGLIAVIDGPGSFTGLRVGLTTAKLYAYATGAAVLGIDAFAAIAHAVPNTIAHAVPNIIAHAVQAGIAHTGIAHTGIGAPADTTPPAALDRLSIAMDAQRGQLLAARWQRTPSDEWRETAAAELLDVDRWLASLSPGDVVVGPALGSGRPRLADVLPSGVVGLPETCWTPTAATVARLAWRDHEAGRRDSLWTLLPRYYRPSAAEEKRAES